LPVLLWSNIGGQWTPKSEHVETKEVGTLGISYLNKACEFKHRGKMNDI